LCCNSSSAPTVSPKISRVTYTCTSISSRPISRVRMIW
jgi:hypothetical protein